MCPLSYSGLVGFVTQAFARPISSSLKRRAALSPLGGAGNGEHGSLPLATAFKDRR